MTFFNSLGKALVASAAVSAVSKGLGVAARHVVDAAKERLSGQECSHGNSVHISEEDESRRERDIIFHPQYDSEDGEPAQDVAFVGDVPYVLIKLEGDGGSLVKIRAGGITPETEPWVLQDATNAIVSVLHSKYVVECVEDDEEEF